MSITDSEDSDVEFKPDMHEESESESISSGVDDDCMSDRDNSSKLLIKVLSHSCILLPYDGVIVF